MSNNIKQDLSIGDNLKRLRNAAGLTQCQAAAQLQLRNIPITREILAQMEMGRYSVRVSALIALRSIYHVESYDEFFAGLNMDSFEPHQTI